MKRAGIVFGGAVPALLVAACQLIAGIDSEQGATRADGGLATDAGDPCVHATWPAPPAQVEDSGRTDISITFAMRHIQVAQKSTVIGYDLDGYCTGMDGSTTSGSSCSPAIPDYPNGVDDAVPTALSQVNLGAFGGNNPDTIGALLTARANDGFDTTLVTISNYNQSPDDEHVGISIIRGTALANVADGGVKPLWDGGDVWNYPPGTVAIMNNTPVFANGAGYVTGGVLVATNLTGEPVAISVAQSGLTIHAAVLTATIGTVDGIPALTNGVLAGRVTAQDLVQVIRQTPYLGMPACISLLGDAGQQALLSGACAARDIPLRDATNADPSEPCDGLSVVVGFDAAPAVYGFPFAPTVAECAGTVPNCP